MSADVPEVSTKTAVEPTEESDENNSQPSRKRYLDFEPIKIKGEPLSVTILRDRGPY